MGNERANGQEWDGRPRPLLFGAARRAGRPSHSCPKKPIGTSPQIGPCTSMPRLVFLCTFLSLLSANAERPELAAPPPAKKEPVTDTYHGVTIRDDYRWLENLKSPETLAWAEAQNVRARHYLDSLPIYPKIRADVEAQIR